MDSYRYSELVRKARLQRTAVLAEIISNAIAKIWFGLKRFVIPIAGAMLKLRDRTAEHLATAR